MNGRVYDPVIGRFLSPDLLIQAPFNTQSYNRYSYVFNNPLSFVDPSGYAGECPAGVSACEETKTYGQASGYQGAYGDHLLRESMRANEWARWDYFSQPCNRYQERYDAIGNMEGNSLAGYGKAVANTLTGGIVYGDISSIDAFNLTPQDIADLEAFKEANPTAYYTMAVLSPGNKAKAASSVLTIAGKTDDVVKKLARYDGPKPKYHVNPAHVPGERGFNPRKTPLPTDAEDVFKKAVPNDATNPTAWFGKNSDGQIYRFSLANDGTAHFSGIDGVGDGVRNLTDYAVDRINGF